MFADVLYFIQIQLDRATLTFCVGVGLTLNRCTATLAWNYFVFGHYFTKIQDRRLSCVNVNKYDKSLIYKEKACG